LWQPIDTAPKDGTIVLGYFDNDDETFFMSEIMWIKSDEWFIGSASAPLGPSQWFSLLRQGIVIPTHWMPLPAPPKMEKKND
jgi:hypothetical protein